MDPRPVPAPVAPPVAADPLAAIDADIDALDGAPSDEQLEIYGRIHSGLAAALAGTQQDTAAGPGQPGATGPGPRTHP